MRKVGLGILISLIVTVLAFGVAYALPPSPLPTNQGTDVAKDKSVAIDDTGDVIAPPPFVQDLPENQLNKVIFIRYNPGKKPSGPPEPSTSCYGFLSGAKPKWNWVEDYYYSGGLETVSNWATQQWDGLTSARIFRSGSAGAYTWGDYDGKNSISFGQYTDSNGYSDPNIIAVTAIWYLGKNIYEYDIMFDDDYFPGNEEVDYDLETVALHEFGHAAGLDDLYNSTCSGQVMYGYYVGENITFGSGDIAGIKRLYGP